MRISIPYIEPDRAYISNQLWLPTEANVRGGVRVGPIKKALEFTLGGRDRKTETISLWFDGPKHIICPREFLPTSEYPKYKFPFVDIRPSFSSANFEDLVEPRNEEQWAAWRALAANSNGILNLGCGKGKTKLALKKIAQRGVPALVVVPDGGILEQWRQSIFGSDRVSRGLNIDGELGIIQGSTFDWKHPLTLALVTTLALKIRDGKVPEELFRHFGLIIYDEVHTIGAPVFSQTAWPFYGDRIGLTATVQREDGLDPIYRYHIGEPFYSDITQDLIPYIYFQKTPTQLDSALTERGGKVNISLMRSMLGRSLAGNTYRYWAIREALEKGRKILCLSHSKDQLRLFHEMFPGSGLIISETDRAERLSILRNSQVCFAIAKLGATGVDDDRLDTLFWLTPCRSLSAIQQSIGRVQRSAPGKPHPVVVIFEEYDVSTLRNMCQNLKATFKHWKFKFEVLPPTRVARPLPEEARLIHERKLFEMHSESLDDDEE